jgi:hypothetical protein
VGHSIIGVLLGRRMGLTSPLGMAMAVVAASLPDADVFVSVAQHGDPWKGHRTWSHGAGFAMAAGFTAGAAGMARASGIEGERDLIADGLAGMVLVGSHTPLDRVPMPYPRPKGTYPALPAYLIDAVVYGAVAWLLWPRNRAA